jgi:glycosyltransferase involved in cell wall biosynthesis
VLVIDNGSTDNTHDIAMGYVPLLQLSYVNAPEPGLHVGRHEGMQRANSDVLIFADDDIEAEPGWVEAVVETFENPSVALVGGNNYPLFEVAPPDWLMLWWERPVYKGRALGSLSILDFGDGVMEIEPSFVWGCNFSIRRAVLHEARGFHPDGVPKEKLRFRGDGETYVSEVVRRSGLRTLFNSRASVRHLVTQSRMTESYFQQRAYAQGISDSFSAIRRNRGLKVSFPFLVRQKMVSLKRGITSNYKLMRAAGNSAERTLISVQQTMAIAYRQGYEFHQKEVKNDPLLFEWVLKNDYLK